MKKQVILAVATGLIASSLLMGCTKTNQPAESKKTVNVTKEADCMKQYGELIKSNASIKQYLDFVRANIDNLSKSNADTIVAGYLAALTNKLENSANADVFSIEYKGYSEYKDLKELQDALKTLPKVSEAEKTKLVNAYVEGYKLHKVEDGYVFLVNYDSIGEEFSKYLSDKYIDYVSIMGETVNGKDVTLFTVPADLEFITSKLIKIENYRNKYGVVGESINLSKVYGSYVNAYFCGGKYSYTRDADTNILKPEVLKVYMQNQKYYAGSNLEKITTGFLKVLEKNNNKFTDEVFKYINDCSTNHDELRK